MFALGLSGAASAGTPTQGLGQSWPNARDVSLNPHYHAYRFLSHGITYIQINDSVGNTIGAVADAGGQFIVLPIGHEESVATPQEAATTSNVAAPAGASSVVYNDGSSTVTATPMTDGTTTLIVSMDSICTDPAACGSHSP
ncbi:hypothetical protein ISN73_07095 [Dyella acidisoli]